MKEIVVLYSGGTDSTCATALVARDFERVHLLSFSRFGIFSIQHTGSNVLKLQEKFGANKFIHRIINIDKLFREVCYSRYLRNLASHGFFLLATCGLCKIAMHIRALVYCLDHGISHVCDGANNNMDYAPDQIRELIDELKKLYSVYGIEYVTPVYELSHPGDIEWFDKLGVGKLFEPAEEEKNAGPTTGEKLFQMGIFPQKNLKGTPEDRRMQARCFQLVLANIFAHWFYIPGHGLEKFKQECVRLYKEKLEYSEQLIREYKLQDKKSRLFRLIS